MMNRKTTNAETAKASHTTSSISGNVAMTSTSALATTSSNSQPSIIIYFSSHHTVMVGYDNVPQPRHMAELPFPSNRTVMTMPRSLKDSEIIFQYFSSTIERLIHLLGGGSPNAASTTAGGSTTGSSSNNTTSRLYKNRYIVLHEYGLFMNRYWKLAIMRILYDVCHATYISFLSTIHMIPFSIVSPSTVALLHDDGKGSKSASSVSTSVILSVHITRNDAQCMIYANGYELEYTYQSCEYCTDDEANIDKNHDETVMVDDVRKRQEQWLCSSASPLIYAIALCIEKCPVASRKAAIQNIYFSGTLLVHGFQEKVVLLLYEFLTRDIQSNLFPQGSDIDNSDEEITRTVDDDEVTRTSPNTTMTIQFTQIPINRTLLRPLAPYIAMIENNQSHNNTDSHSSHRRTAELIPWMGACIYSTYWQHYEQHQEISHTAGKLSPGANKAIHEGMNWMDVAATLPNPWKNIE